MRKRDDIEPSQHQGDLSRRSRCRCVRTSRRTGTRRRSRGRLRVAAGVLPRHRHPDTPAGHPRCYYASDNLESPLYRGLTPGDLIDIAAINRLHFDGACQKGVVFHLIGALSEFGKIGVLCIAPSHEEAKALYRRTTEVLDRESTAA